jgi:hypothetical protein
MTDYHSMFHATLHLRANFPFASGSTNEELHTALWHTILSHDQLCTVQSIHLQFAAIHIGININF